MLEVPCHWKGQTQQAQKPCELCMHQTQPSQARGRCKSMRGARRDLLGEFSLPGSGFSTSAGVNQMLTRL